MFLITLEQDYVLLAAYFLASQLILALYPSSDISNNPNQPSNPFDL